jgi:hypothetical protein
VEWALSLSLWAVEKGRSFRDLERGSESPSSWLSGCLGSPRLPFHVRSGWPAIRGQIRCCSPGHSIVIQDHRIARYPLCNLLQRWIVMRHHYGQPSGRNRVGNFTVSHGADEKRCMSSRYLQIAVSENNKHQAGIKGRENSSLKDDLKMGRNLRSSEFCQPGHNRLQD